MLIDGDRLIYFIDLNVLIMKNLNFSYTNMSLTDAYEASYGHALELISGNGGRIEHDSVTIRVQHPQAVRFERCFEGIYPVYKKNFANGIKSNQSLVFKFKGCGFVMVGDAVSDENKDGEIIAEMVIDNKKIETAKFPTIRV